MPTAIHETTTPTRRAAIGFSLATLAAGLTVPALAATNPDAELIRLADEILADHVETHRLYADAEAHKADSLSYMQTVIWPRTAVGWERRVRLAQMRATTLEGFQAKARVVQEFNNCAPGYAEPDNDDAMAWSLANDLLGVPSVWTAEDGERSPS